MQYRTQHPSLCLEIFEGYNILSRHMVFSKTESTSQRVWINSKTMRNYNQSLHRKCSLLTEQNLQPLSGKELFLFPPNSGLLVWHWEINDIPTPSAIAPKVQGMKIRIR